MTDTPEEVQGTEPQGGTNLKIHMIKTAAFRAIHVDGAHGGPTPQGLISMNVYSERAPIPQQLIHNIKPDHSLGEPVEIIGREGIVRDVEASLIMNPTVARSIAVWLIKKADIIEKLIAENPDAKISTKGEGT